MSKKKPSYKILR